MAALHRSLHVARVVIVTPSVYGTNNTATLDGMKARGAEARGVAVVDEKTPESELDAMHGAGVRGIRINRATGGVSDPALAQAPENRHRPGQGPQLARPDLFGPQSDRRAKINARIAGATRVRSFRRRAGGARCAQPGFADVLDLVQSGKAYVKISGADRASKAAPDYTDVVPLAKALIAANPDRIVWGFTGRIPTRSRRRAKNQPNVTPLLQIDDGQLLNLLPLWAPDAATDQEPNPVWPCGLT